MRPTHVRLLVDEFEAWLSFYRDKMRLPVSLEAGDGEELWGRGVDVVTNAHNQDAWMIRVAHFRDPDGHLIQINAPIRAGR
jgi:lactoylglutathione lyase